MAEEQLFKHLNLGMRLEVLTEDNNLIFIGELKEIEDETLRIFGQNRSHLPPVVYNTRVKLKGFLGGMRPVVLSGQICGSTSWFWQIDRLEFLYLQESRTYFRQRVNRSGKVMRVDAISMDVDGEMEEAVNCGIVDVSGRGILLQCREEYAIGDHLLLSDVSIVPEIHDFSFTCKVMRVVESLSGRLYGCQFEEMDPKSQDRLLHAIFIAQRKDVQAHRERDK